MPRTGLPPLDPEGFLPLGVHNVTLEEVRERFGQFQSSDRRPRLFEKLEEYVDVARRSGVVVRLIIDGSFVTAKADPEDIDLVAVVKADHDFSTDLPPDAYNALAARRAKRLFGFDVLVAPVGSDTLSRWVEFFSEVKGVPGRRKGTLEVIL